MIEHRLDGHLVLAGDELPVEGRLHELVEEAAAEQATAQLGELQKKKLVFATVHNQSLSLTMALLYTR